MNTFYFNTGVRPENVINFPYEYHKSKGHVLRNGTLQIPFECEAPLTATLKWLCDNPNLDEAKSESVKVYPVFNTTMCSKYAYFII